MLNHSRLTATEFQVKSSQVLRLDFESNFEFTANMLFTALCGALRWLDALACAREAIPRARATERRAHRPVRT